ncbi:Helix-turn-helix domain-containing protein [bacterium A37T11]|nr:Helix-turn-helix domain-containing protein [bacterium A37T11]
MYGKLRLLVVDLLRELLTESEPDRDKLKNILQEVCSLLLPPEEAPPTKETLPEHVDIVFICNYLGVHRATFYRRVHEKLIQPLFKIGRRSYYLLSDLINLKRPHQKGAHTYSKL